MAKDDTPGGRYTGKWISADLGCQGKNRIMGDRGIILWLRK